MKPSSSRVCVLAFLLLGRSASAWYALDDKQSFPGHDGKPVGAVVLTIDPARTNLRLASTRLELGSSSKIGEYSVTELSSRLAQNSKAKNKEWVIVNGGFSSYRLDVPLGLLVVNDKVYSTLSKEKGSSSSVRTGSEYSKYRWSGVWCEFSHQPHWGIVAATKYQEGSCKNALQAGPVLVEPGSVVGISASEPVRGNSYIRTAICLTGDGKIRVVLTRGPTTLLPLAKWLAAKQEERGVGCDTALNLSGDDSSAIATKAANRKVATVLGQGSFPVPTVLIFEPRAR